MPCGMSSVTYDDLDHFEIYHQGPSVAFESSQDGISFGKQATSFQDRFEVPHSVLNEKVDGENVHLVFGNCRVYVSTEEVSYHLWPYLRPHSVFADLRQGFQPEAQFVGGTTARRRPCAPQHGVASRCLVHGKHGPAEVGLTWLRGLQDVGSTGAWSQCRCCGRG